LKQANRFLNAIPGLIEVAQHHESVGPVLLQEVDGLSQLLSLLVNVGQQSQPHGMNPRILELNRMP
jgi:hypothetical protein